MKLKLTLLKVFVFLFFLNLSINAFAFQFSIDPSRTELTINPGEKKNSYVTVTNTHESDSVSIRAYVQDLIYLPDGSNDFVKAGSTPWSCAEWIKINPDEFYLLPDQEKVVKFQVKVPPEASGGYYGVIFFEVLSKSAQQEASSANVAVRIGSLVLVDIAGTAQYSAKITDLSVVESVEEDSSGLDISCIVKNSGNILIRPTGTMQILDAAGVEESNLKLNPNEGGILPGTSRKFNISIDEDLEEGKYEVRSLIDYGGVNLLGGRASFELEASE